VFVCSKTWRRAGLCSDTEAENERQENCGALMAIFSDLRAVGAAGGMNSGTVCGV
jgi:hypothetical protein